MHRRNRGDRDRVNHELLYVMVTTPMAVYIASKQCLIYGTLAGKIARWKNGNV